MISVLKCKSFISDHRELKNYVNQKWFDKLMILMNSDIYIRVVFENLMGITVIREIDMTNSPREIVKEVYEEDPATALQFFAWQYAFSHLVKTDFSEFSKESSSFELLNLEGDSIRASWRSALWDQLKIKEEMENIINENQVPTFIVDVGPYVLR